MSGSARKKCCCPEPPKEPQACCLDDGSCLDVPPSECVALGGTPQGKGTECIDGPCDPAPCPTDEVCLTYPTTLSVQITGFIISCLAPPFGLPPFSDLHFDCVVEIIRNVGFPCVWNAPDGFELCGQEDEDCIPRINVVVLQCGQPGQPEIWIINFRLFCVHNDPEAIGVTFNYSRQATQNNQTPFGTYSLLSSASNLCGDPDITFGAVSVS